MLCDICHKNPATIHLTEIIDEKIIEMHICQNCANEKKDIAEQHFDLSDFAGAFAEKSKRDQVKCKNCGLSYQEFKKGGKLGCRDCCLVFKLVLLPFLKKIHGAVKHCGKFPKSAKKDMPVELKIVNLKRGLKQAVEAEEYEQAAQLRDKIKKLDA